MVAIETACRQEAVSMTQSQPGRRRSSPPRCSLAASTALSAQSDARTAPLAVPLPQTVPPRRTCRSPARSTSTSTRATSSAACSAWSRRCRARGRGRADPAAARMAPGQARRARGDEPDRRRAVRGRRPARAHGRAIRSRLTPSASRCRAGAREVTARFVYTSPLQTSEGRIVMTPEMLNLQWEAMSLYPGRALRAADPLRADA